MSRSSCFLSCRCISFETILLTYLLYHFCLISSILPNPQINLHFQALQKIHLANHIIQIANLMHVDAVQQWKVALLGLPATEVVDLLSTSISKSKPIAGTVAQPGSHTYTTTPPVPPPDFVSVAGVSESNPVSDMVTTESKPNEEIPTTLKTIKLKISSIPVQISKFHCISTTLIRPSVQQCLQHVLQCLQLVLAHQVQLFLCLNW